MLYFGLDGDSIGRIIESYLIENNVEELEQFSKKIVKAIEEIKTLVETMDGKVIFCTGDSILFYGEIDPSFGEVIVRIFKEKTNRTASVGIGKTTAFTYLGLKLAKSKGGNQVVYYNEKTL
ncbi:MAG: mCpol domain-containing protein [Saprospiraceae bacterium]